MRSCDRSRLMISLLALVSFCETLPAQQKDEAGLSLGVDSIHTTEDVCLMLGAKVVAGDFFKGLRAHETHEGRTFQKHGRREKFFPERLIVKIVAALDSCVGKGAPGCDRCDFKLDGKFMNSLHFEAYWKHGFDMRKANMDVMSVEQSNDLASVEPNAQLLKYELSVNAENVPLTDALVVVIITPDGRIVSRLSGRL